MFSGNLDFPCRRTDIRTDITKLTVAFRDFANASENGQEKSIKRHCHSRENII